MNRGMPLVLPLDLMKDLIEEKRDTWRIVRAWQSMREAIYRWLESISE